MLIELLRRQIKTCGKSRYRIFKDTGVKQAVLCRLMQGSGCKAETVDVLLKYFGFVIVKKHKQERGKK
jgi:hypothetical protein